MSTQPTSGEQVDGLNAGITRISVGGYKSLLKEQHIDIRPLTILAGANSSGKSSIMQPLLLLKQTLEASYDPGTLMLNGPNIRFTSSDQLLSRNAKDERASKFFVTVGVGSAAVTIHLQRQANKGFEVQQAIYATEDTEVTLRPEMTHAELSSELPADLNRLLEVFPKSKGRKPQWMVVRNRCLLDLRMQIVEPDGTTEMSFGGGFLPASIIEEHIRRVIHLPGLRGNPERTYPITAVGSTFPGTFEKYAASVISQWQANPNLSEMRQLGDDFEKLGLTWKVASRPVDDTQVEIRVGRLPHAAKGGARDLVNIADVGFGASQALPVLVALRVARPEQLVYLEQPEIHLHPRAQTAMAQVLADAANRGVRVVAETHSAILILAIQSLVAEGYISPEKVRLHWFRRHGDGTTEVTSADLDEAGAYGDWPEDFAEIALEAESRYLDASEQRQRQC